MLGRSNKLGRHLPYERPDRCAGGMIPTMASAEQQRESLNIQLLVDSIPALIHTAWPDGCIDYFNGPRLDYLSATVDDVTGWKWTAFVPPDDVDGIVAQCGGRQDPRAGIGTPSVAARYLLVARAANSVTCSLAVPVDKGNPGSGSSCRWG